MISLQCTAMAKCNCCRAWLSRVLLIIVPLFLVTIITTCRMTVQNTSMMSYSSPNSIENGSLTSRTDKHGTFVPKNFIDHVGIPPEYNHCIGSGKFRVKDYIPLEFVQVLGTSGVHQSPSDQGCNDLKYLAPPGAVTALASFTGSGNTWMRHVLQQATG